MSKGPPFSAGEMEKFSYCPLSWWLGSESGDGPSREKTAKGTVKHMSLSSDLLDLSANQQSAGVYSRMIMYYALISTILAILGVSLLDFNGKQVISRLFLLLAVIWLAIAASLLYLAYIRRLRIRLVEKWTVYMAVAAVASACIAITTLQVNTSFAQIMETASLLWLVGGSVYLHMDITAENSAEAISGARNVKGRVVYVGDDSHPVLYSRDGMFSGKPDFIVEEGERAVPGEFKSGRIPAGPLFSHIMQLSAYCKLVEDNYGARPEYGYIYYGQAKHTIDYDDDIEKLLLSKAEEMRKCLEANEAHRNHRRPGKCAGCSRREICPERLV